MNLQEYDYVTSPANQAARSTKPTPNIIPPIIFNIPPQGKEEKNVKNDGKGNDKGEPDRPNIITRQASEGQRNTIHFMSRYDVLTYPLTINLAQKNKSRTHQVLWYLW